MLFDPIPGHDVLAAVLGHLCSSPGSGSCLEAVTKYLTPLLGENSPEKPSGALALSVTPMVTKLIIEQLRGKGERKKNCLGR